MSNSFDSNSLNPDQAGHFVRPDLDLNCLQRLSADGTSQQRITACMVFGKVNLHEKKELCTHEDSIQASRLRVCIGNLISLFLI